MKKKKLKNAYVKRDYKDILRKVFWVGFCGILGIGIIGIIRTSNLENMIQQYTLKEFKHVNQELKKLETEVVSIQKTTLLNEEGAKLYACDFLKDFYTWEEGDKKAEERANRLQKYFVDGLELEGGYDISRLNTSSRVAKCEVFKLVEKKNEVKVTVKVNYVLTSQTKTEEEKPKKAEKQEERYVTVSLVTDGERFRVNSSPYIVQCPIDYAYVLESEKKTESKNLVTDESIQKEVSDFMATFYKVATTATVEELKYYSTAKMESMLGLYEFVKMDELSIYETKEGYQVFAKLRLQDSSTKAEVILQSKCDLKREKERFIVTALEY